MIRPVAGRLTRARSCWRLRASVAVAVISLACLTLVPGPAAAATYQVPPSVAGDCSVDVTSSLASWIASVPDYSTLSFGTKACFRIEGTLELSGRRGLALEGKGSTFRSFDAPTDQRAIWRVWDSTGVAFRHMTIKGSYAAGGKFDANLQHAHAIDLRGTNAEVANVTMMNLAGDCVYFGLGGTSYRRRSSGSVHDSTCLRTSRNAISVTAGNNILVQRVTTQTIGYDAFDVEPNVGPGWGSRGVTFNRNLIGSYRLSAYSIIENAPISDQAFTSNHVIGRGLKITIGHVQTPYYHPSRVRISGNTAAAPQAPAAINLSAIDGLRMTDNTIPMTGGTMAQIDTSCSVNVSRNNYPGGAAESYVAPYPCPTVARNQRHHGLARGLRRHRRHKKAHAHRRDGNQHA